MSPNKDNGAGPISAGRDAWLRFAGDAAEHLFAGEEEPSQDLRRFGAYLRRLRYRRGLGLSEVAEAADMMPDGLARLEQGMVEPRELDTDAWARLIGLLDGKEPALAGAPRRKTAAPAGKAAASSGKRRSSEPKEAPEATSDAVPAPVTEIQTGPVIGVARIKVIGVGGGGSNAVARMFRQRVPGVEYAVVNTDSQHLKLIEVPVKIRIGDELTRGLGVGGNPEVGRQAAMESRAAIEELVKDADMVFIACGMGGGTGTGAAPIIAEIAKESGALTIAAVTKPFAFEGRRRMRQADEGVVRMRPNADTLIIIPNDRLATLSGDKMTAENAFRLADDVLRQGVQSIAELITVPGEINLDFADVKSVMSGSGPAWMAIGHGRGESRALDAAKAAMASPLLDIPVEGATRVLLNIAGGDDLKLQEVNRVADYVSKMVDPDANIIFGMVTESRMQDEMRVTVIATGLRTNEEMFNEAVASVNVQPDQAEAEEPSAGTQPTEERAPVEPREEQDDTPGILRFFGFGRRKPKDS